MTRHYFLYFLLVILLGLGFSLRISRKNTQILPKNQPIKIIATIKNEPKIYETSQVLEVGDSLVYTGLYPRYRVGDRLSIAGQVEESGRMYQPAIEKLGYRKGINSYFSGIREKISQNFAQILPVEEATLVSGTVLGIDNIGQEFRDTLIKTGTIHVVVVSGQNLMIVAGVFLSLAQYIGKRKSLILALLASVFYAMLTGFEPPVVRATLMVLASTLAIYFGREAWPIWSLVLAALLILFVWPTALFEISFQLTFAATLGIMTLGQRLTKVSKVSKVTNVTKVTGGIKDIFVQNAAIALSAYIFTAPVILYYFGRVSILSPIVNVLVIEAVFPVMILGFIIAILSLIFMPIAQIVAYFAFIPVFYFVKVVELFGKIPVDQVSLGQGNLVFAGCYYMSLIILMVIWNKKSVASK